MKTIKSTMLIMTAIICCSAITNAQKIHVVSVSQQKNLHNFYSTMKEAFPLAFNDPASPRFIFYDDSRNFIFGVGCDIKAVGVYDFNGISNYNEFITGSIPMKHNQPNGSYAITANQSQLFFKLIGNTRYGKIISYMQLQFVGDNYTPILRQAFVDIAGFHVGKAWSTFGDMSVLPYTIDEEGPGSAIAIRQPQIRYTLQFSDSWKVALALEYAQPTFTNNKYTSTIRQKVPDIPLAFTYTNKHGHIQVAGIFRDLAYNNMENNKDRHVIGWGASLSAKMNLCSIATFMCQGFYGKAIANYIQDITGSNYDLLPDNSDATKLKGSNMWGAFAAMQSIWNRCGSLKSSIGYSYTRIEKQYGAPSSCYKYAQYAVANLLWSFSEFGTIGIEGLYGRKNEFSGNYGNAFRVNTMIQYHF